jgi:hypothetical protein
MPRFPALLSSFTHETSFVSIFPNANNTQRIDDFVVLRQEVKKVRRKDVMVVVVALPSMLNNGQSLELHAIERNLKIIKVGSSDYFFTPVPPAEAAEAAVEALGEAELPAQVV